MEKPPGDLSNHSNGRVKGDIVDPAFWEDFNKRNVNANKRYIEALNDTKPDVKAKKPYVKAKKPVTLTFASS